jgi:hypothetical protein
MKQRFFVSIFLILLMLSDSVPAQSKNPVPEPAKKNQKKTAVWLKLNADSRIDNIINRIKQNKISLIYLQTSKKNPDRPAKNRHFISQIQKECPETRIYPWVGMVIHSPTVLNAKNLLQNTISFAYQNNLSGLHLDFEPPFGSQTFEYVEEYFLFLAKIKNQIKTDNIKLSIAVFPQMLRIFYEKNPSKRERLCSLAENIDQYVLMMYDTGIREEKKFRDHLITHIGFMERLIGKKKDRDMIIGIASYGWHRNRAYRWMHDPGIENIKTTITLVKQYQNQYPNQMAINGYAIFRYGTTDKGEWDQYSRLVQ